MGTVTRSKFHAQSWFVVRILLCFGIVLVVVVTELFMTGHIGPNSNAKARASYECWHLKFGLQNYRNEYGRSPSATNNAELIKTLNGMTPTKDNPRGIPFLSLQPSELNEKGEMIDPWGTPLQFNIDTADKPHARSAGPDKIFGTADDVTNE